MSAECRFGCARDGCRGRGSGYCQPVRLEPSGLAPVGDTVGDRSGRRTSSEPGREPRLVDPLGSHGADRLLSRINIGCIQIPDAAVEVGEDPECRSSGPFVAIRQRVVPCRSAGEHRRFVEQIAIEALVIKARGRRMERRVPPRGGGSRPGLRPGVVGLAPTATQKRRTEGG